MDKNEKIEADYITMSRIAYQNPKKIVFVEDLERQSSHGGEIDMNGREINKRANMQRYRGYNPNY